ncbi:MAG: VOC family protein [Alkalibacterium thalassium]|nr:VOC family protein [Alkalibacterium thalassium]
MLISLTAMVRNGFSITFEVDGLEALADLHKEFREKGMNVGDIENRGHAGRNFVFSDLDNNSFDVWSELSPRFKEKKIILLYSKIRFL